MSLHLELATTVVSTHFPLSGFFTGGSAFMISWMVKEFSGESIS
jgi:hypothetical protein